MFKETKSLSLSRPHRIPETQVEPLKREVETKLDMVLTEPFKVIGLILLSWQPRETHLIVGFPQICEN